MGGRGEIDTHAKRESKKYVCSTKELNVRVSIHGRGGDHDGEREDKGERKNGDDEKKRTPTAKDEGDSASQRPNIPL